MNMKKNDIANLVEISVLLTDLLKKGMQVADVDLRDIEISISANMANGNKSELLERTILSKAVDILDTELGKIKSKVDDEEYILIEYYKIHAKDREIELLKAKNFALEEKLKNL